MHGNGGSTYAIDSDTKIDSDLDAVEDNDIDNKDSPSYNDGSIFSIERVSESTVHKKEMKLTIKSDDGKIIGTKNIQVIFDYIPEISDDTTTNISGTGADAFSTTDKENLEKLQTKIRSF